MGIILEEDMRAYHLGVYDSGGFQWVMMRVLMCSDCGRFDVPQGVPVKCCPRCGRSDTVYMTLPDGMLQGRLD